MIPTKEEMRQALEKRQGKELQQHFFSATVAICGLGGLGSNIAISLARAGVGKLILIDFDKVDVTNLHRQQYKASQIGRYKTEALSENLKEIAPYVELETQSLIIQNIFEKDLFSRQFNLRFSTVIFRVIIPILFDRR